MTSLSVLLGLAGLTLAQSAAQSPLAKPGSYCPVFYAEPPTNCRPIPDTFLSFSVDGLDPPEPDADVLEDAFGALAVLQRDYFDADYGTWPTAIDWTAAASEMVIAGMLTTLSKSLTSVDLGGVNDWKSKENLISSFYAQLVASYFGQDVLSIRAQAYDDMLWVVLGWLEAIKFVATHARLHYPGNVQNSSTGSEGLGDVLETLPWHGHNWVCSFAHRARIFWNLASHGWGSKLCHGGMIWNPRLSPYKNAITNELWISASISMYHDFPGDNFTAPWLTARGFPEKDPSHLAAAVEGYRWLMNVNMTNSQGLFVDGYHIDSRIPGNVECDLRDEMVYTYNQGVILTGQRGLWHVSGAVSYLEEGHRLIQTVINATGWSLRDNSPVDDLKHSRPNHLAPWRGLGRGGIIEERCDASGTCSQDSQTFKGIFFHHLGAFCMALNPFDVEPGITVDMRAYHRVKSAHAEACRSYLGWIRHNAVAALDTRDAQGRFGMWWGPGLSGNVMVSRDGDGIDHSAENTTDYRNQGTPQDDTWGTNGRWRPGAGGLGRMPTVRDNPFYSHVDEQVLGLQEPRGLGRIKPPVGSRDSNIDSSDPNSRGRGRSVETQVGGLALLRAYWEMSRSHSG